MTDAEINEAVAKALGWELLPGWVCMVGSHERSCLLAHNPTREPDPSFGHVRDPRELRLVHGCDWAQSLDACFRDLAQEARDRDLLLHIKRHDDNDEAGECWWVGFADKPWRKPTPAPLIWYRHYETPSRALCLAWLKTKDVKPEYEAPLGEWVLR